MADTAKALQTKMFEYPVAAHISQHLLKTSEDAYVLAFAALNKSTGKIEGADDAADLINGAVYIDESHSGDEVTNKTGDGTIEWTIKWGYRIPSYPVTGASAITDAGELVYPTDNQKLTLTRPSVGSPCGRVVRWLSSTNCEIQMFTFMEALNFSNAPERQDILLGTWESIAFEGTSALELITDLPFKTHGKIVDFFVIVNFDSTSAAGAQTFTLDIGATPVTGASIALDKDDGQGTIVSSTAITAANEFNRGDTLTLHMAGGGTGWTASERSSFSFYITIEPLPGA